MFYLVGGRDKVGDPDCTLMFVWMIFGKIIGWVVFTNTLSNVLVLPCIDPIEYHIKSPGPEYSVSIPDVVVQKSISCFTVWDY